MELSKSGASLAIAAVTLMLAGVSLPQTASADDIIGRCFGVNACKGQGACKSEKNSCKGQNSCKGAGFVEMSQADCDLKSGKFKSSS